MGHGPKSESVGGIVKRKRDNAPAIPSAFPFPRVSPPKHRTPAQENSFHPERCLVNVCFRQRGNTLEQDQIIVVARCLPDAGVCRL